MPKRNRRSGFSLVLVGLAGAAFFWYTDARHGLALRWSTGNPIDLANQYWPGTVVGLVGSGLIAIIGLLLLCRRSV